MCRRRIVLAMSRAVASLPAPDLASHVRQVGRRSVIAVVLIAIAGVAIGLALALRPSPGPGAPRPLTSSVHTGKLSVSIPRGFNVYTLRGLGPSAPGTPLPVAGYVLTNFGLPTLAHRRGRTAERLSQYWRNGPLPNQVGLELTIFPWPLGRGLTDRLHLPLTLKQPWAKPWYAAHGMRSRLAGARAGFFRLGGTSYEVVYWIGPTAAPNDRAAILRAVRSIRPTR